MSISTSLILLLGFIIVYEILLQVFTILFRLTGMTYEKARFQVISLLTACGYTTSESEIVADDKLRRNIAKAAMLVGYAFSVVIVTLLINIIMNINAESIQNSSTFIIVAFCVFAFILLFFHLPFIKRLSEKTIEKMACKILNRGKKDNVITFLDNYGKDAIAEVYLNVVPDFLKEKSLFESGIKDKYAMNILMVKRKNRVIDVTKDTIVQKGDRIVIFGSYQNLKDVFRHNKENIEEILDVDDKINDNVVELLDNYGKDAMAQITIHKLPSFLVGKTLRNNSLKEKFNINVIMIKRSDKVIPVTREASIEINDEIVVFGPYKNIKDIFLYYQDDEENVK